jgi:hypothetical protein
MHTARSPGPSAPLPRRGPTHPEPGGGASAGAGLAGARASRAAPATAASAPAPLPPRSPSVPAATCLRRPGLCVCVWGGAVTQFPLESLGARTARPLPPLASDLGRPHLRLLRVPDAAATIGSVHPGVA